MTKPYVTPAEHNDGEALSNNPAHQIKSTDTKAHIDFYQFTKTTLDPMPPLNLDRLKTAPETQASSTDSAQLNNLSEIASQKSTGSLGAWIIFLGALSFILVNAYQLGQIVLQAYADHAALGLLIGVTSASFILLLFYLMAKEVIGYLKLNQITDEIDLAALLALDDKQKLIHYLEKRAHSQGGSPIAHSLNQRFFKSLQSHHSTNDVLQIYRSHVDEPLQRQAQQLIKTEGYRTGGAVLLSPNDLIQTLALIWQNLRVIKKISQLYGLRLGFIGNLKLLKILWENVLLQSATDKLVENLVQDISNHLVGALTEKVTEAATSGTLTVRIGLALVKQLKLKPLHE